MTKVIARGDIYRGKAQVVRVCGGSAARVLDREPRGVRVAGKRNNSLCHQGIVYQW